MAKEYKTLAEAVKDLKPTALMGLSGVGGSFTEDIIKSMGAQTNR
jgi:malic enzyme